MNTRNPQVIEAYIWIAMLTLLVSRRIHKLVVECNPDKEVIQFTGLRWSTLFSENAGDHLTMILDYVGIQRTFETVMNVYSSPALDPNVHRHRFMEEWFS